MKTLPLKIKQIVFDGSKLYAANNMDSDKLNEYSQFMIGSITKVFTFYTILILQQENLLNVNDKVSKYIKSNEHNNFSKITIFDLMNHTSKIKRDPDDELHIKEYESSTKIINRFINEKLFTLKQAEYSNIGPILLGGIIEQITGLTYLDAYNKYIFKPLKMKHTSIGHTNITLYNDKYKKLSKKEIMMRYFLSTSGGLHSCVHDMILFSKNIMKLLNKKSIDVIKKLYIRLTDNKTNLIHHDGRIRGGSSDIHMIYDNKWNFKSVTMTFKTNL